MGGRHPDIVEETRRSDQYFTVNFVYHAKVQVVDVIPRTLEYCSKRASDYVHKNSVQEDHSSKEVVCAFAKKTSEILAEEQFYRAEAMGTVVSPECGACKCGKCPIPGSKYCLKEEQDMKGKDRIG